MEITSRDNRLVKEYRKLAADAKYRHQSRRFVLEGARLCGDAASSSVTIETVLFTARAQAQYSESVRAVCAVAVTAYTISDALASYLGDTQTPQGIFCIAALPTRRELCSQELKPNGRYAALECVQDPANLGTVIRAAEAFGLDGLILSDGCCDPYSPKVLRGSMGGVFRLPLYFTTSLANVLRGLSEKGFTTAACVVESEAVSVQQASLGAGTVCVIGNEGNGLSADTKAACSLQVTIPMGGRAESLNASVAAGIVFWEMVRGEDVRHAE
ncbi:MAG: RNA methyltransferase [Clostridia bacterium]|nr:RNA methyltransferase [Clostridia bacterium]